MRSFAAIIVLLWFAACDQPGCPAVQENKILSSFKPDDSTYQQELTRLLVADSFAANYYFNERIAKNNRTYLSVNGYGEGYCGTLHLLLEEDDDMSRLLQNNSGWGGAGLSGLHIKPLAANGDTQLVYTGLDHIVD